MERFGKMTLKNKNEPGAHPASSGHNLETRTFF